MERDNGHIYFRVRKRPWYAWFFWLVSIIWMLFWLAFAIGSWKEMEYRAFYISSGIILLSLVIAFIIWLRGYVKYKKI